MVLLSLSLWVSGQGLTCGTDHWFSGGGGGSNPSPTSLENFIFCWFLLGQFPKFSAADGLRPSDPKDSSKAAVDECLDLFQFPCFSSIKQDRFYCFVKDPDFDVDGQVR